MCPFEKDEAVSGFETVADCPQCSGTGNGEKWYICTACKGTGVAR